MINSFADTMCHLYFYLRTVEGTIKIQITVAVTNEYINTRAIKDCLKITTNCYGKFLEYQIFRKDDGEDFHSQGLVS